jgi:hypothetical protein
VAGVLLLQLGDVLGVVVDEPCVVVEDEGDAVQVGRVLLVLLVSDAVLVGPEACPVESFAFEPVFGAFGVTGQEQTGVGDAETADEHSERGLGNNRSLIQQCAGKCQALDLRLCLRIIETNDQAFAAEDRACAGGLPVDDAFGVEPLFAVVG